MLSLSSPLHLLPGGRQQLASAAGLPASRHAAHLPPHAFLDNAEEALPKRPRLMVEQKAALHPPLHIDTRDMLDLGKKVSWALLPPQLA